MNIGKYWIAAAIAALLAAPGAALADKPSWAGNGKHGKKVERDEAAEITVEFRFGSDARRTAADYYGVRARAGHCPPGLAKKNNGCLPPGQAKKWRMGQPLPHDARFHDLPPDLLRRLPPPPPRHRYVQVAGDILMIAIGTSMVVDAMEDLLR